MAEAAVHLHSLFDDVPVADLGSISIRVFVLPPKPKKGSEKEAAQPLDLEEGEVFAFENAGSTPLGSYLESNKGKRCVVFLVNGQRQKFLDNTFIVQELGFKYLRARMMVAIDVDGLAPEAIGKMMQGSRQGFYRGDINLAREISVKSVPSGHWAAVTQFQVESDSRVLELNVKREKLEDHGKLTLLFNEAAGFDADQFCTGFRSVPIVATAAVLSSPANR